MKRSSLHWITLGLVALISIGATAIRNEGIEFPDGSIQTTAAVTGGPGIESVYFKPEDSSSTATVITLFNTTTSSKTVTVRSYRVGGTLGVDLDVQIVPYGLARVVSDPLDPNLTLTDWVGANVVNFTNATVYGELLVPAGVKVSGYVEWNQGSYVNPTEAYERVPIRFTVGENSR